MTPTIEAIPVINTALLAVLVFVMAAVVYRRHVVTNSLYRQNMAILALLKSEALKHASNSKQLLDMVKILVTELRQRPCVTTEVTYKTDVRPPSSASKKLG